MRYKGSDGSELINAIRMAQERVIEAARDVRECNVDGCEDGWITSEIEKDSMNRTYTYQRKCVCRVEHDHARESLRTLGRDYEKAAGHEYPNLFTGEMWAFSRQKSSIDRKDPPPWLREKIARLDKGVNNKEELVVEQGEVPF